MAKAYQVYGGFGTVGGKFKDEISPFLNNIAGATRGEAIKGLKKVAYETHVLIKKSIISGNADGIPIPDRKKLDSSALTRMNEQMRNRRSKKGKVFSRVHNLSKVKAMMSRQTKRFMGNTANANRSLLRAVNYAKTFQGDGYVVGWGSKSAASYGGMVQSAGRGSSFKRVQFQGNQPISAKQKRFFAAIGLPTKKQNFQQPKADFFGGLMVRRQPWMGKIFEAKIREYIKRREDKAKAT